MGTLKRKHSKEFKAKVALEAIKNERTIKFMFSFHQFFNSSFRARQGKVLYFIAFPLCYNHHRFLLYRLL